MSLTLGRLHLPDGTAVDLGQQELLLGRGVPGCGHDPHLSKRFATVAAHEPDSAGGWQGLFKLTMLGPNCELVSHPVLVLVPGLPPCFP